MILFALLHSAVAAPLNPWGSATSKGSALVNPYVYVYPEAVNPIVYGSTGLGAKTDVYFGYGELLPNDGAGVGSLEFFPRYFVDPSVGFAAHVYWTPGVDGVTLAPEIHFNHTWTAFAITANAGWRPLLTSDGFSEGTVPVIVAPEVRFSGRFTSYVEIDPTFSLEGADPTLTLVPGFGVQLDPEAHHAMSVGFQIPVAPDVGPASVGAWYCFTFPVHAS
jgi:hypothetical protein